MGWWKDLGSSIVDDTLGTNIFGENSTDRALSAQRSSAQEATGSLTDAYGTQQEMYQPWQEAGLGALSQMQSGDIQAQLAQDPGYQFRMQQGLDASNASAAARGGSLGGAQMKALQRYGQGFASNEYDKAYGRLSGMANMGYGASQGLAQSAGDFGSNLANVQTGMGNAQASAHIAQANRMSNMIGQGAQAGAAAYASDERLKTDIKPINKTDLDELRSTLKPYAYKYKNKELGEGEIYGVMAQDLEKSKLGKTVIEEKDGYKFVNIKKATSLFLAVIAEG